MLPEPVVLVFVAPVALESEPVRVEPTLLPVVVADALVRETGPSGVALRTDMELPVPESGTPIEGAAPLAPRNATAMSGAPGSTFMAVSALRTSD